MRSVLMLSLLVCMMFIANVALSGPPTNLTVTFISNSQIDLSWTDGTTWQESGYRIIRNSTNLIDLATDTTMYSDTGLSEYTDYTYQVQGLFNGSPAGPPSNSVSPKTKISPPSNLTATAISVIQIDLSWTDNSGLEDGFKIERKTTGDFSEIGTAGANATAYSDVGLSQGTEYTYRVRAYTGVDNSDYSNEATETTPTDVEPPTIVSHSPQDGSILDIEPQNVKIIFEEAMDTASILVNSSFTRTNVTDGVTEVEAPISLFLTWFGFPSEATKYNGYGCTGPYGLVTSDMVDVNFTNEHGETNDTLNITLVDITIGEPKKPIGPKEYRLSITLNGATDLAGNQLSLDHIDYTYYMTEAITIDNPTQETILTFDNLVIIIPANTLNIGDKVTVRPPLPSEIPSFLSPGMNIIGTNIFVIDVVPATSDLLSIASFNPPVTIHVSYDDSDIPTHPGEAALRLYRVKDDRWQPILGFPPNTVANTLDADVTEFGTFALLNGAPYGDLNGTDGDNLIDIADVTILLKQIVVKAQIFGGVDVEFAKYAADVSLAVAGGEPEIPDIGDVVLILKRIVGKIDKFPVEEVGAGPSLIALYPPASGHSKLFMKPSSFGNSGTISIILDNASDILSAEIGLIYDAKVLKFTGVSQTSFASHQVMEYNAVNAGELQIALVSAQPLNSADPILNIQFEMAEGASKFELDSVKMTKIKLNNGLVKTKLETFSQKLTLLQNYPNPFNPETWIPYKLNQTSDVKIRIYNFNGQLVQTLHMGKQSPGNYVTKDEAAYWDGRNSAGEKVTSGVYFYQLLAGTNSIVKKMVILK